MVVPPARLVAAPSGRIHQPRVTPSASSQPRFTSPRTGRMRCAHARPSRRGSTGCALSGREGVGGIQSTGRWPRADGWDALSARRWARATRGQRRAHPCPSSGFKAMPSSNGILEPRRSEVLPGFWRCSSPQTRRHAALVERGCDGWAAAADEGSEWMPAAVVAKGRGSIGHGSERRGALGMGGKAWEAAALGGVCGAAVRPFHRSASRGGATLSQGSLERSGCKREGLQECAASYRACRGLVPGSGPRGFAFHRGEGGRTLRRRAGRVCATHRCFDPLLRGVRVSGAAFGFAGDA